MNRDFNILFIVEGITDIPISPLYSFLEAPILFPHHLQPRSSLPYCLYSQAMHISSLKNIRHKNIILCDTIHIKFKCIQNYKI